MSTPQTSPDPEPSLADLLAARPALKMHAQDGLCFENILLNAIADAYGTPTWIYGAATFRARYAALKTAFAEASLAPKIHYAVKANDHLAILSLLHREGAGADVVSHGEILRALKAGIEPNDIVFSGVGKTATEIRAALAQNIGQINIESPAELLQLSAIAAEMGKRANIVLRMNPDVDAGTHAKITTGRADNKFGIAAHEIPALYAQAATLPGIRPVGLALHIGSQIISPAPFAAAFGKAAALITQLRAGGHTVTTLDLGGGLGIGYRDEPGISLPAFAHMVRRETAHLGVSLILEPGRYLAAPAGLLLTSVILEKTGGQKRFCVLDAAMNDLIRPAMYDSYHAMLPVSPVDFLAEPAATDIVGPVCETGDTFAVNRALPRLQPGARLAILDCGAYGAVMSSTYNARPRAAAILIDGAPHLITPRQAIEDLWASERVPA